MLYFFVTARLNGVPKSAGVVSSEELGDDAFTRGRRSGDVVCRCEFKTMQDAEAIAAACGSALLGEGKYLAVDEGPYVSPRYDVIEMFQVGEKVSYAFNGDYYPCGVVTHVSMSLRRIVATDEKGEARVFYRRGQSSTWKYQQTWSLVRGHVSKLNPEF